MDDCLLPAIIMISFEEELFDAYDFLVEHGAIFGRRDQDHTTFLAKIWSDFSTDGRLESEGALCLRIDKNFYVNHSGDKFYRREWKRDYNHGTDYVEDDMFCISWGEYVFKCTGVPYMMQDFEVAEDAALLGFYS